MFILNKSEANIYRQESMLCISTSKRMLAHAFAWSKMSKKVPFSSCTRKAHEEKSFFSFFFVFFVSLSCA